jgi:hypothetical protein
VSPMAGTASGRVRGQPRRGANLLLSALRDPLGLLDLAPGDWNRLLPLARRTGLLARLAIRLEAVGGLGRVPETVREHCRAAMAEAASHARAVRWEIGRIERALAASGFPVVLLKGAAYVLAGLPAARGRLFNDVDILVPRRDLGRVEQALRRHGWQAVKLDEYDQRYYRTWMHELPPLRHRDRHTTVDVHHAILPLTGRLRPDPERLLQAAVALPGSAFKVLEPPHMVLHSAAHLFQDGDLQGGLRDLTDLDALLGDFGATPDFWGHLLAQSRDLDLGRPLFYALRFAERLLGTPVPRDALRAASAVAPAGPILAVMDRLARRALLPPPLDRSAPFGDLARWLLFVRSHWLRMPPRLLASHLLRKALRRRP